MKKHHKCELCGTEFGGKSNLIRHLERVRKCNVKTTFTCNWCNKSFSNNSNMTRHHTTCSAKKEHDMLKEEMDDKLEQLADKVGHLEQKILDLTPHTTTTNNNNTPDISGSGTQLNSNGDNGTNTIDNSQTTISGGITIHNYGSECMEHMTLKRIIFVFDKSFRSVLECVKLKHFSPLAPQNKNVCIRDMKSKYAYTFCDGNWDIVGRTTLIDEMYEDICEYLEEKVVEFADEIDVKFINKIRNFLEKKDEDNTASQIKDDLMMLLFNKRHVCSK
jgi:hypothetical protein